MGAGSLFKLGVQERFSTHIFPCNAIELMLNFAKVGGSPDPSKPHFLRPWKAASKKFHLRGVHYVMHNGEGFESMSFVVLSFMTAVTCFIVVC